MSSFVSNVRWGAWSYVPCDAAYPGGRHDLVVAELHDVALRPILSWLVIV